MLFIREIQKDVTKKKKKITKRLLLFEKKRKFHKELR